ncbi:M48 family metallopeptidase [Acinetobacter rathckeae]|uniref:M48 family metallopeptidase n=1 Tax=Acinetobacter rathckeae TaxID=2605272 RepID=UPI0018A29331|nr:M48 family metallopeptidase [Acinetobacter rathckeae]MBF7687464.1 M48 family metallopeptidase [Acinetobacter rathckeae]MBF7694865.1 M48 family metallopeptidase [Acinetobacter rathckeae]
MKNKAFIALGFSTLFTMSGCTTVADMAGADSATLNATSAQSFAKMQQEAQQKGVLDTSSSTYKRIYTILQRMEPYANQLNQTGQAFQWQLAVIKSDTLNAYVAPGGKVVFYTGIVNKLNLSDDEIAAIMGHEMTHALEEHAKNKIGADALTNLAINIGKSYAGQSIGQFGNAAIDLGSQVGVGLPYSRNLETRADYGGLMLMAKAGYNPQAAITLWEKMNKAQSDTGISFLSTHPSNAQRIAEMKNNLPAAMAIYNRTR